MKKIVKMLIIVVISSAFCLTVSAEGYENDAIEKFEQILPDKLTGIGDDPKALVDAVSLGALLEEIILAAQGEWGSIISFLLLLLGTATLMSLSEAISVKLSEPCRVGVGILCTLMIFERISAVFSSVDRSLTEICNFFSAAIPIMTGLTVAGGGTSTAAAQAVGMNMTISLIGGAGATLMLSVVGLSLALALLSAFGDSAVGAFSKSLSGFFKWTVGIATAAISAVMSLQSVVASAADSAAMRAAKYAASGLIPIVGGAVSGALSTLASGLSYAKSIVGAGAIATLMSVALAPLAVLLLYRLSLSLSVSFADLLGTSAASRIFAAYRTALDNLIAVYALCSVLCIFEVILFMKGGVALL